MAAVLLATWPPPSSISATRWTAGASSGKARFPPTRFRSFSPKDEDDRMIAAANQHRPRRWWLRLLILAVAAVGALLLITALRVARGASQQELHHADAIVVFGAAEYSGRPSPVLKARLDHALDLFHRGVAPIVITTGGAAGDPVYSEGGVGVDYLMHHGIPERSLIAETQ